MKTLAGTLLAALALVCAGCKVTHPHHRRHHAQRVKVVHKAPPPKVIHKAPPPKVIRKARPQKVVHRPSAKPLPPKRVAPKPLPPKGKPLPPPRKANGAEPIQ